MTAPHRFGLTLAVILVVMIGLAMCGYQRWERDPEQSGLIEYMMASAQSRTELCMDEQTREQIRGVMIDSLNKALSEHIQHAFEIWMKDQSGQPTRAKTGVDLGVRAYIAAHKSAQEWMPPACAG